MGRKSSRRMQETTPLIIAALSLTLSVWFDVYHNKITELKKERDLEARYMTFEELLRSREKDGVAKGMAVAILELLEEYGTISETLKEKISAEEDLEVLKKWHKLAAKVSSIEEFTEKM